MRRLMFPVSLAAVSAALLLALGGAPAVHAEVATGPFDRLVAAWMGVVGVIGADEEAEDEAEWTESFDDERADNTFAINDEGDAVGSPRRQRGAGDWAEGGRHRHRDGHAQGGRHMGGPPMHGPHHRGMGPGRIGPPEGPDEHRHAMRAFREIIRRLGRIEEKLGIEAEPRSGREGDRPRWPRDVPEDVRRQMDARMQEGRRRMAEAKDRMEQARQRFQAMEERVKQLEAEVERLKGAQ
jgi:hypothetical protein